MEIKVVTLGNNESNFDTYRKITQNKSITSDFRNICIPLMFEDFENIDNVFFEDEKELTFYFCYPLSVLLETTVKCKSLYDILNTVKSAYKKIFKSAQKYGIWGHGIYDLVIEGIKIYDSKYVNVGLGS